MSWGLLGSHLLAAAIAATAVGAVLQRRYAPYITSALLGHARWSTAHCECVLRVVSTALPGNMLCVPVDLYRILTSQVLERTGLL